MFRKLSRSQPFIGWLGLFGALVVVLAVVLVAGIEVRAGSETAAPDVDVEMVPAPLADAGWTRWRGPSGQGLVDSPAGVDYVERWSKTENILWRSEVPGRGNSSPIVLGDKIFLTTAFSEGERRAVLAFARVDGALLWQTAVGDRSPEKAYPKNGHATSTPTTDGERLYAYFGNHGLLAVDLEGEIVWHNEMGPFDAYHGTASSPLLHDGRLILVQDHDGSSGSFIAAFDPETGKQLWRTPRDARVGWNSPVAVRAGDRDEIVMSGQQKVTAYDPQTGRELWFVRGNTFEVIPSPVVGHDLIFCSSGRAGPTLAIRPGGSGDVTDSHVVWSSAKGSPFVIAPLVYGDYLYMVNDMASVLTVHAARTGEVVWQTRLGRAQREGFSSAPVAVEGKLFFTNDDGTTFVVNPGPDFAVLHTNELDEQVIASPALVGGIWYFRTATSLLAIGDGGARSGSRSAV